MTHYILTSPRFSGQVELKYNEVGMLTLYSNESEMNQEQHNWIVTHLPVLSSMLAEFTKRITGDLREVPPDLTYETAYKLYGFPRNSYKAKPLWAKMSDPDRMQCILSFKEYHKYLRRSGHGQMIFDRYLREKHFETTWDKVQSQR
ncbi:hypothetical protein CK934_08950 [Chitinophaga sp. MD30]|nr:hypothetical protein CK934_08950 [Chitinophaga sp. MD30]